MSRDRLADLLFPDAADPLGALRWNLSQLRRAFGDQMAVAGDPVQVSVATTCEVDVTVVPDQRRVELGSGSQVLLEGHDGVAGPEFDLWLTAVRHRLDAAQGERLRDVTQRPGPDPDHTLSVAAAADAVLIEPDDMVARGALVHALTATGDYRAALAQLRQWSRFVRRELQLSELLGPHRTTRRSESRQPIDPDVLAQLDVGLAVLGAGEVLAGLGHLRNAVRLAGRHRDERLQGRALFTLGSSVVHGVAAHSAEGAQALREAARLGRRTRDSGLVAQALRDLAYIENARGRVVQARRLLTDAVVAAEGDPHALSSVRGVEGMVLADRGQHGRALLALRESARLAEAAGHLRQAAWSLSGTSRSLMLQGKYEAAEQHAERSRQLIIEERWMTMRPWPEAILAEVDLAAGRVESAERRLRYAWSSSLVLGDWCWQGMAARGLGLAAFARGDSDEAVRWLDEATRRAAARHDRNPWVDAFAREALCRVAVTARLPRAGTDLAQLTRVVSGTQLPDFVARARAHGDTHASRRR